VIEKEKDPEAEEGLKRKAQIMSIWDGSMFAIHDGCGLRYITPYALLLGATNSHIGFLSSTPQLLGSISQLLSLRLMEKGYGRKTITIVGVLIQSLMWFPILALGILHFYFNVRSDILPGFLIVFYSLLIISGMAVGPAWSSWMSDIMPKEFGGFFGVRNRVMGIVTLASMLAAGFILQYFKDISVPVIGFTILFFIAFLARSTDSFFLIKQYEPVFHPQKEYYFTIWQFIRKIPESNFGKFVVYVSLLNLASWIAAPFFAVYMLKDLHFSYVQFTIICLITPIVTLIFMPAWGRFADSFGNLRTIRICGWIVPFVPFIWCFSPMFHGRMILLMIFLGLIESLSGFAWAGFNLAAGNFIYDAVTKQRVAICVAYYTILNGTGIFVGSMLGGFISSLPFHFFGLSVFLLVFFISGLMRLGVTLLVLPLVKEVRDVKRFGIREAKERLLMLSAKDVMRYFSTKF